MPGRTLIAACHDVIANLPVPDHAAGVWHEHPGFAGNIGAQIPGVFGQRQQRLAGDVVDLGDPFVHRVGPGLDAFKLVRAHVSDAVGDPVGVLLDRHRHVAQHGRAAWSGDREQVWKAGDLQTEVIAWSRVPCILQRHAVAAFDVIRSIGPVMASKPVAKTMMSRGYSASVVHTPLGLMR